MVVIFLLPACARLCIKPQKAQHRIIIFPRGRSKHVCRLVEAKLLVRARGEWTFGTYDPS